MTTQTKQEDIKIFKVGDVVEGTVIATDKNKIFVDLSPVGTGIIYGREFLSAREVLKNVNPGDSIEAKIIELENEDGYIELSLKEARQAIIWSEAIEAVKNKTVFELPVKDANKGGLMIEWQGIVGFLPASQLAPEHYPRVEGGDKDQILQELKQLIGQKLPVVIMVAEPKEQKLIFSEKGATIDPEDLQTKFHVGDVVEGEVTGATDFGIFVKLADNIEGLVHISEMDWALVEDPKSKYRVGDKVKVKIIEIKDGKISLSIKALSQDPWKQAAKKYKKGDIVQAVIIKYNRYGALASVEEGVAGLVHVSDFESMEELREKLSLGQAYKFEITIFEPQEHKMALKYLEEK